jgi:hypothetical protein
VLVDILADAPTLTDLPMHLLWIFVILFARNIIYISPTHPPAQGSIGQLRGKGLRLGGKIYPPSSYIGGPGSRAYVRSPCAIFPPLSPSMTSIAAAGRHMAAP